MKKISSLFLTGIIVLVFTGISFGGETYTYTTDAFSESTWGLSHSYAYSWEIDLIDSEEYGFDNDTETLDSVTLVFNDIQENTGDGDILQISILDSDEKVNAYYNGYYNYNVADGIVGYYDYQNPSNYFTLSGAVVDEDVDGNTAELLFTLENVSEYGGNQISVTYNKNGSSNITRVGDQSVPWETTYSGNVINALTDYISENVLTIGLDPDCHYYASSISLILTTSDTPGGASHAPEPETMVLFGLGLLGFSALGRKRYSSMG